MSDRDAALAVVERIEKAIKAEQRDAEEDAKHHALKFVLNRDLEAENRAKSCHATSVSLERILKIIREELRLYLCEVSG